MNEMMFDSIDGFYGHGEAELGYHGDFTTNATKNNFLAFLNAIHKFQSWQKAGKPDSYINCEGGAGNGKLAYETLMFIEGFADEEIKTLASAQRLPIGKTFIKH